MSENKIYYHNQDGLKLKEIKESETNTISVVFKEGFLVKSDNIVVISMKGWDFKILINDDEAKVVNDEDFSGR